MLTKKTLLFVSLIILITFVIPVLNGLALPGLSHLSILPTPNQVEAYSPPVVYHLPPIPTYKVVGRVHYPTPVRSWLFGNYRSFKFYSFPPVRATVVLPPRSVLIPSPPGVIYVPVPQNPNSPQPVPANPPIPAK